jgi:hypothetical protein
MAITDEATPPRSPATAASAVAPPARMTAAMAAAVAALTVLAAVNIRWAVPPATTLEFYALLAAALLPVAAVAPRNARWALLALLATWFAMHALYSLFGRFDFGLPVSRVVGGGPYFDSPYQPAQFATVLILALALGVAVVVGLKRPIAATPPDVGTAQRTRRGRLGRGPLAVIAGTAVAALAMLPDLWSRLSGQALAPIPYGWDTSAVLSWHGFLERGLMPVKDFFYPYGHRYVFDATPWGAMWQWLAHVFVLACVAWAFWRLTRHSVVRTLLIVVLVAALLLVGGPAERYFPGLLMGVVYAAIGPGLHRRPSRAHLVLAALTVFTAWLEPDVVLMGLAGIGLIALGEIVSGRLRPGVLELVRRLAVDALPLLPALLVPLIWLAEGTYHQNMRFWAGLQAVSVASSRQQELYGVLLGRTVVPTHATLIIVLPALLLTGGLILGRMRPPRLHAASMLLLAGAAATELALLKSLVREANGNVVALGLATAIPVAVLLWSSRALWLGAAIGVFAAFCFLSLQSGRVVSTYLQSAWRAPSHVVDSARLPQQYARVAAAEGARFAPARFAAWLDVEMANAITSRWGASPEQAVSVVGDSPMLYALLNQPPPYHTDLYNAARKEEQRVYVNELKRRDPAYLVFRYDFSQDDIPQVVRNPLIISHMIRGYTPVERHNGWDLLARREGGAIDVAYWRQRMGEVDLGYVPAHSSADSAPRCGGGPGCVQYAMVRGGAPVKDTRVRVRVTGSNGRSFVVVFHAKPGVGAYPIRLDRMWFAPMIDTAPAVRIEAPAGFTVTREGRRTHDALY